LPHTEPVREGVPSLSTEKGGSGQKAALDTESLTDREEKVLELIAEGMTNRQIAGTLFLAEGTVKNYVSRIMDKLHANTRTELAVRSKRQRE
jgi:DNA-binding NarL/FixJ family response regulator